MIFNQEMYDTSDIVSIASDLIIHIAKLAHGIFLFLDYPNFIYSFCAVLKSPNARPQHKHAIISIIDRIINFNKDCPDFFFFYALVLTLFLDNGLIEGLQELLNLQEFSEKAFKLYIRFKSQLLYFVPV